MIAPLLLLAAVPFGIKAMTLLFGASGYGVQSVYKLAQLFVPVAWRLAHGERRWAIVWPVRESLPSVRLFLAAVAVAVCLSVVAALSVTFLAPVLGLDPSSVRRGFDARFSVSGLGALGVVVFLSFLNSALEELHFRLWLDRELSKRAGDAFGITVSACAFGGMHGFIVAGLPGIPTVAIAIMAAGLAVAGASWSLLLRRPGGMYAAWLSHGLTDALLLTWGLFWLGYL